MKTRSKKILKTLGIVLPILLLVILAIRLIDQEPLTPEAVAAKKKWSDEELSRAMGRSLFMTGKPDDKKEMMKKLGDEMKKRSDDQQKKIQQKAFQVFLDNAVQQYRALPSEKRQALIQKIAGALDSAIEQSANAKISEKDRAEIKRQMDTPEAKAAMSGAVSAFQEKLTPDERVELAPVTKLWVQLLQTSFR